MKYEFKGEFVSATAESVEESVMLLSLKESLAVLEESNTKKC